MAEKSSRKMRKTSTERRNEILAAAAEVFSEKGFGAATTREIGKRVSMLSGSLYHYFPTKEDMAMEIVSRYMNDLIAAYEGVVNEDIPPGEKLRRLIEVSLEVSSRRPHEVQILYQDWPALNNLDGALDKWMRTVEDLWLQVLNAGAESGELRSDLDPRLIFRTVMGSIAWVPRWFRPDRPGTIRDVARVNAEIVRFGLANATS
jgi:TetR/AcrR family transcriptional regulator, cholesterol catabolism regulator